MGEQHTCTGCGCTFISLASEEEAQAEYEENFPEQVNDPKSIVCDDCYETFMEWYNANQETPLRK